MESCNLQAHEAHMGRLAEQFEVASPDCGLVRHGLRPRTNAAYHQITNQAGQGSLSRLLFGIKDVRFGHGRAQTKDAREPAIRLFSCYPILSLNHLESIRKLLENTCICRVAMRFFKRALVTLSVVSYVAARSCRCLPEDDCWPSKDVWSSFNSTVGGSLVKVTPIGAVCHDPTYDEAACAELRSNWDDVKTQ
ncbi:hypothetical protein LIA77_00384 [Sarocladium implicatum]|nr:hypothetical protein LIA77_00384 [Sarocladium implicatum]